MQAATAPAAQLGAGMSPFEERKQPMTADAPNRAHQGAPSPFVMAAAQNVPVPQQVVDDLEDPLQGEGDAWANARMPQPAQQPFQPAPAAQTPQTRAVPHMPSSWQGQQMPFANTLHQANGMHAAENAMKTWSIDRKVTKELKAFDGSSLYYK